MRRQATITALCKLLGELEVSPYRPTAISTNRDKVALAQSKNQLSEAQKREQELQEKIQAQQEEYTETHPKEVDKLQQVLLLSTIYDGL